MNRSVKTLITVAAAGGALAVVSACGSSGGSGSNTGNATVNQPQSSTGTGSDITMHSTSAGTVLADKSGNTLYLLTADTSSHLACSGGCLTIWKPVLVTTGTPSAASGVTGTIGVVSRGSAKQVTVAGHPLYTYAADSGPGQAAGQGVASYGGTWWVVGPSGAAITSMGSSSSGGSSPTPANGYGY